MTPEHFILDPADETCSAHLIRNAFGGIRRDLFTGVMSARAPHSRVMRDDITVVVFFFGSYGQEILTVVKDNAPPGGDLPPEVETALKQEDGRGS